MYIMLTYKNIFTLGILFSYIDIIFFKYFEIIKIGKFTIRKNINKTVSIIKISYITDQDSDAIVYPTNITLSPDCGFSGAIHKVVGLFFMGRM